MLKAFAYNNVVVIKEEKGKVFKVNLPNFLKENKFFWSNDANGISPGFFIFVAVFSFCIFYYFFVFC